MSAPPRRRSAAGAPSILGAALAAAAALAACGPATAAPPVWTVHGAGGSEVTLFGSVHLLQASTRWRTPALDAQLAHADKLMFEIPLDAAADAGAQGNLLALGRLPEGETLRPLLSAEGRKRLEAVAAQLALPIASLDRMRPWLAEVVVSVTWFQKEGARTDLGVERQIAAAAPAGVARGAFESVDDQLQALAGGSKAEQVQSLEETLHEVASDPDGFARLAAAWARGDVRTIEKEGLEDLRHEAPGAYGRLVVDRNRRWVGEIEALLKRPGRTFAVVGVGHLVGPDSVPALLRRDGIAVDGPR